MNEQWITNSIYLVFHPAAWNTFMIISLYFVVFLCYYNTSPKVLCFRLQGICVCSSIDPGNLHTASSDLKHKEQVCGLSVPPAAAVWNTAGRWHTVLRWPPHTSNCTGTLPPQHSRTTTSMLHVKTLRGPSHSTLTARYTTHQWPMGSVLDGQLVQSFSPREKHTEIHLRTETLWARAVQ